MSRGGFSMSRGAPAMSADGQVVLFGRNIVFDEGEYYTLQSATILPSAPSWATVVGNGYWLSASAGAPDLTNSSDETSSSISFQYLGAEVPPGEEDDLTIYFWNGNNWRPLDTELDIQQNFAAAPTRGPGLYALMSSFKVALHGPGWNNFAYPLQEPLSVVEALASINGFYATVYGLDASDTEDPWKIYAVGVPEWVNDLQTLEPGQGYFVNVTQDIDLRISGGADASLSAASTAFEPPATFYGVVSGGADFVTGAGREITAKVNGQVCARTLTRQIDEQIVYAIDVPSGNNCGELGEQVVFYIANSEAAAATVEWNNNQVSEVRLHASSTSLDLDNTLFMPLVHND